MRLEVRKRQVADVSTMGTLVAEHVDAIEPGLTVIDSRLLLGHATIDLVARDVDGSLVLMALGVRGDEGMLLRVVDAYSWCLEYPESVQRHYPTLEISEGRPPRVVFVMTRVPESFQRKVKQLSFPSVDAVELHYIDVNGVPAVYFDLVAQIRRGPHGAPEPIARNAAAPVSAGPARVVPEAVRFAADSVESAAANRLASALVERLAVATEPPVVVSPTVAVPVIAGSSDAGHGRVSLASAMCHVIDASARLVDDHEGGVAVAEREDDPADEPLAAVEPLVELADPIAIVEPSVAVLEPVVDDPVVETPAAVTEEARAPESVEPSPEAPTAVAAPDAEATKAPEADASQKSPFSEAARAAQLAQDLGIQLPKEGALTRQWIDFLNQLAAK
jgi:hypothetical protein